MLQFNNNHIFTGYLKQFLSSFNLPTCKVYTAEFEKFYAEHGYEDPRVIESNLPIYITNSADSVRPAVGITYLKDGNAQQYFWDTHSWETDKTISENTVSKYWKSNSSIHYNGNKILGLTKTLKNPTTLYNYQTHEYLGDYLRFLRDYEGINLMSMYNCFSNRLCNNIKIGTDILNWEIQKKIINPETGAETTEKIVKTASVTSYDSGYKIYMLPVKLFENYTVAIDCYQGVEMFCGFYNEKLDTSSAKAKDLIKKTYLKVPKALFSQPFIYDKLNVSYWNWEAENTKVGSASTLSDISKILRSEVAVRESELKLFIKIPATNTSSIAILEGDYRNFNDSLYIVSNKDGWKYFSNSTVANFETKKTYKYSTLPDINSREFKPISKLQLLALNTGISYPFADRLVEYLVANVILPNDATPDNIRRLQKVMEDCGYSFQIDGVWEPKMQMILYDYLMNGGKFVVSEKVDKRTGKTVSQVKNQGQNSERWAEQYVEKQVNPDGGTEIEKEFIHHNPQKMIAGNLRQRGQKMRSDFYDILGYVDKDAEKLYASWKVEEVEKNGKTKQQVVAKNTLENVDIYSNLYNV